MRTKDGKKYFRVLCYYKGQKETEKLKVDVYLEEGFLENEKNFYVKEIFVVFMDYIEVKFEKKTFDVTPKGLFLEVEFKDKESRTISIFCKDERKSKLSDMIAPIGFHSSKDYFSIVYMDQFALSERSVKINIEIDKKKHTMDYIPMLYLPLCRYAGDLHVFFFLIGGDRNLKVHEVKDDELKVKSKNIQEGENDEEVDVRYIFKETTNGNPEITQIKYEKDGSNLRVSFNPPLPNVMNLEYEKKEKVTKSGKFCISTETAECIVVGEYFFDITTEFVITLNLKKAYQPFPGKPWVEKFSWICKFNKTDLKMSSQWIHNDIKFEFDKITSKKNKEK